MASVGRDGVADVALSGAVTAAGALGAAVAAADADAAAVAAADAAIAGDGVGAEV